MNWLDFAILLFLSIFTYRSYKKGVTKEVFGIAGLIIGLIGAYYYFTPLGMILEEYVKEPIVAKVIAFVVIFLFTNLFIRWIGSLLEKFLKGIHLGFINKILGAALGLVKGYIIVLLILIGFTFLLRAISIPPVEKSLNSSQLVTFSMNNVLPKFLELIQDTLDKVKKNDKKLV